MIKLQRPGTIPSLGEACDLPHRGSIGAGLGKKELEPGRAVICG
jgi:hypothetical protein